MVGQLRQGHLLAVRPLVGGAETRPETGAGDLVSLGLSSPRKQVAELPGCTDYVNGRRMWSGRCLLGRLAQTKSPLDG